MLTYIHVYTIVYIQGYINQHTKRGENMKTRNEITNKIDSLMAMLNSGIHNDNIGADTIEHLCCQIDALLWVIDDKSGAPLICDREN